MRQECLCLSVQDPQPSPRLGREHQTDVGQQVIEPPAERAEEFYLTRPLLQCIVQCQLGVRFVFLHGMSNHQYPGRPGPSHDRARGGIEIPDGDVGAHTQATRRSKPAVGADHHLGPAQPAAKIGSSSEAAVGQDRSPRHALTPAGQVERDASPGQPGA